MEKIQMTVVVTFEFNPENYPQGFSIEEACELEQQKIEEGETDIMDHLENPDCSVNFEVVETDEETMEFETEHPDDKLLRELAEE